MWHQSSIYLVILSKDLQKEESKREKLPGFSNANSKITIYYNQSSFLNKIFIQNLIYIIFVCILINQKIQMISEHNHR